MKNLNIQLFFEIEIRQSQQNSQYAYKISFEGKEVITTEKMCRFYANSFDEAVSKLKLDEIKSIRITNLNDKVEQFI